MWEQLPNIICNAFRKIAENLVAGIKTAWPLQIWNVIYYNKILHFELLN